MDPRLARRSEIEKASGMVFPLSASPCMALDLRSAHDLRNVSPAGFRFRGC